MPNKNEDNAVHLENSDVYTAEALLVIRNAEHNMKMEEKRQDDSLKAREHARELEIKEIRIREIILENERMKLQSEENSKVREHELSLKHEEKERMKLELEIDKIKLERDKLKQESRQLQFEDNRQARLLKEKIALLRAEELKSAGELLQQQREERNTAEEEQRNRSDQLERQRREEEEQNIRSLRNLGLVASGVGAASGAIGGALGTTATVGLVAGVVGAAAVMAPVAGTVAVLSGAGYVYKKVKPSNHA